MVAPVVVIPVTFTLEITGGTDAVVKVALAEVEESGTVLAETTSKS
jgi:hypothetical protein